MRTGQHVGTSQATRWQRGDQTSSSEPARVFLSTSHVHMHSLASFSQCFGAGHSSRDSICLPRLWGPLPTMLGKTLCKHTLVPSQPSGVLQGLRAHGHFCFPGEYKAQTLTAPPRAPPGVPHRDHRAGLSNLGSSLPRASRHSGRLATTGRHGTGA